MNHENFNSLKFEGLKKEEIERLKRFFTSLDKHNTSCALAKASKYYMTSCFSSSKDCWYENMVVNSGATDHMTYNSYHISSYNPCLRNQKIKVADGTLALVVGQGTITLNSL